MKQYYESEVLFQLMERDGLNIPSSVPPYESEIKAYLINQVKQAYPKLTDYEAEWLLYNYTKHLPAEFPISSVTNATSATFENVVPFAYQSATLKGSTKYRDIDTGDILDTFDETKNLELVSVKMPVLTTTGKNLFDGQLESGRYTHSEGVPFADNTAVRTVNKIKVKPSTVYTLKTNDGTNLYNISEYCNGVYIGHKVGTNTVTFTTSPTTNELHLSFRTSNIQLQFQLEEGSQATSYEPFKTNILTVNEEVELRGIGEVQDELNCLTGELTQRIGEDVLDGSQGLTITGTPNQVNTLCVLFPNFPKKGNGVVMSDELIKTFNYDYSDTECITQNAFGIAIRLLRNKLESADINGVKKFLSQNPITVQYQLETESIKTVDLTTVNEKGETTHFMPLEGTMNVQSSGETIQPTFDMSVPVEATIQNLASFINMEMEE